MQASGSLNNGSGPPNGVASRSPGSARSSGLPSPHLVPGQVGRSPSFGHFKPPGTPRSNNSSFRSVSRSAAQLVDLSPSNRLAVNAVNDHGQVLPPAMSAAPPISVFPDYGNSQSGRVSPRSASPLTQLVNAQPQGQSSGDSNLNIALSPADLVGPPDSSSDTGSSPGATNPHSGHDNHVPPAAQMFKDLDPDGSGTITLKELRRAVARFVGQREVSETDCLDVVERLNAIQPANDKIDTRNITFPAFQKILDAIDPKDFAVQARLKEWFTSLGILDAFAQEAEKFVRKDGVDHKDVLTEVSKLTNVQVGALCDRFRHRVGPIMTDAVGRLASMSTPSYDAMQANQKFAMMDDSFTGNFAEVAQFFKGLDGHIGLPSPRVLEMMKLEHTESADSTDTFVTSNYGGTETWPALEWEFVMNPDMSKSYPGIIREPKALDNYLHDPTALEAELEESEIIALRLFTGPMFMKYNAKLRNFPEANVEALKGNGYVTTIHAVVSAVLKLSRIWKLPPDRKVYRGLGGMLLPEKFWKEDPFGCRGGVELALMSTTIKRDVAIQYSGAEKGRPTIFEIEVGQVDRGASLSWVSQYPMEEEIVMPPLSNLEVVGDARMEESDKGLIMVIPLRINVNLKSLTMDELKTRRKILHLSMMDNLQQEAQRDLMEAASELHLPADRREDIVREMLVDFNAMAKDVTDTEADQFNDDESYKTAMTSALDMKRGTIEKFRYMHSQKMQQVSADVQHRIRSSNCKDWARDGTVYRIISNTSAFPWEAVAEGKLPEVDLPLTLSSEQAAVAWDSIKAKLADPEQSDSVGVKTVTIRGLGGKTARINAWDALNGLSFTLKAEKIGVNGTRTTEPHGVDEQGIRLLLPVFSMNQQFVRVDLSKSTIGVELARELAQLLAQNRNLKFLKIRGPIQVDRARTNGVFDMSIRNSRQPNGSIVRRPGPGSFINRAASVGPPTPTSSRTQTITRGTRLTMGREQWEPCDVEGGIVLAAFIAHNTNILRLDLEGNRIGPDGATALAETLPRVRQLRFLNLRDNNICADGATAISRALVEHREMRVLDVRDNRTGAQGPAQMAPAVHANERLEALNSVEMDDQVAGCWKVWNLTDPAYEMVFVARQIREKNSLQAITSLDFADNQLGKEGARLLKPALTACMSLQHLILRGNALRSDGGREIAPAFSVCTNLQTLDLSYNLIEDATEDIANALSGHPKLQSLLYIGNIKEGFIEYEMCFPDWRRPYKLLCKAAPRCRVTFFTKQQKLSAVASWSFIFVATCLFAAGLGGTPYFLLRREYIFAFGFMGLGVLGLLCACGWVVSRRLLRRMGIINCFMRCVQRQSCFSFQMDQRDSDPPEYDASLNGLASPASVGGANADMVFSPVTPENHMNRNGTVAYTPQSGMEMTPVPPHNGTSSARHVMPLGQDQDAGHGHGDEGDDDGHDEAADALQNMQNLLGGEGMIQQVPMLLEQYVSNTTDPASLDEELQKRYQHKQDYWTVTQFMHSSKPVALALRKTKVKLFVLLFFLYYAGVFTILVWPWLFGDITYRTFRFDTLEYRNGVAAYAPNIDSFAVGGYYCERAFDGNQTKVNNSAILEFEDPVTVGRLKVVTGDNDPTLDPKVFQLLGCKQPYLQCTKWDNITGTKTVSDFPLERREDVWFDVDEAWQLSLLRFVPFVFGLGFLVLGYCSIANRHEWGRTVLIWTFAIPALMYAIASTPNENTSQRMRWLPGGMLLFFPLLLIYKERYFVHGVVLYGLLYCPMVGLIAQGMFEDNTLPQWSVWFKWENYDQLTILPLVVFSNLMLLPLLYRYALYRAHIKLKVERDIEVYSRVWEKLKTNVEALRDLKGEVDKVRYFIEQRNVAVVRHSVVRGTDVEDTTGTSADLERRPNFMARMLPYSRLSGDAQEENRITSLVQVYAQAKGVELLLKNKVQSWALLSGGSFLKASGGFVNWKQAKNNPRLQREIQWGELKDPNRAIQKVLRFYDGDVSKVLDICRQMIVFEKIEHLSHCVAVMRQDNEVQVVKVKNRMDPEEKHGENQFKVYAGYRDVAVNLKFTGEEASRLGIDGHVCEVRLVYKELAEMLQGRQGSERHKRYIEYRNSRGS